MAILRVKQEDGTWAEIPAIVGAKGDAGYTPQKGIDYWTEADKAEIVNDALDNLEDFTAYTAGDNISINDGVISVITTNEAEEDNTQPITSAGVHTQIGNINVLLGTI